MILAISRKKTSGKDTVGKIINIILNSPQLNNEGVLNFLKKETISSKDWHLKKFAEKLKQIACLLIGCTMEQLEDEEFKNTYLDESWDKYQVDCYTCGINSEYSNGERVGDCKPEEVKIFTTEKEAQIYYNNPDNKEFSNPIKRLRMTTRLLLQLLGTECGREIIHPNIWVNSLMSGYKKYKYAEAADGIVTNKPLYKYPNWIITDMRFPNELEAVKSREGITIRVDRHLYENEDGRHLWFDREDKSNILFIYKSDYSKEESKIKYLKELSNQQHKSETALDKAEFDYTINNDGTLEDLINKVREILTKEKFI